MNRRNKIILAEEINENFVFLKNVPPGTLSTLIAFQMTFRWDEWKINLRIDLLEKMLKCNQTREFQPNEMQLINQEKIVLSEAILQKIYFSVSI